MAQSQKTNSNAWETVMGFLIAGACLLVGIFFLNRRYTTYKRRRDQEETSSCTTSKEVDPTDPLMPTSSSSSSSPTDNYEVFLSFRGEDTRTGFTDHLYQTLIERGVRTFRDNEELPRGEDIKPILDRAIRNSDVVIPIISKSSANSKWCLDELNTIVQSDKLVIPIFYHVDPSDVRRQKGPFAESFRLHEKNFSSVKVKEWREAMSSISNRAGYNIENIADGHEGVIVRLIVKEVIMRLDKGYIDVEDHLVGMSSRLQQVMTLIHDQVGSSSRQVKEEVRMVGISGMGGLGKTTLAKAIYNNLFQNFDFRCFLESVRETSKQPNGLLSLQKILVSEISKEPSGDIHSASQGIEKVKRSLHDKRVLLVIDDVDSEEQLDALARDLGWFGAGSRIIITTRDKQVLVFHKIDEAMIYEPQMLDSSESLELFCHHAFGKAEPDKGYEVVSRNLVSVLGGHPLALKVMGSDVFHKRTKEEWEETTLMIKKVPHSKVEERLRLTVDGLKENVRNVFLDVACFFIGMETVEPICMWKACEFYPITAIKELEYKSLLKIDDKGRFWMHDVIRDIGRHMVVSESKEIGRRSRIWNHEEALAVLRDSKGSENVEGIMLKYVRGTEIALQTSNFASLSNLRFLSMPGAVLEGSFACFPPKLKWLDWSHNSLEELPEQMNLTEVAVLNLKESLDLKRLWDHDQKIVFSNLRILDLEFCKNLEILPDLSGMLLLERLILRWCRNLEEIPDSVCFFKKLKVLDMLCCLNVKSLPENLGDMESLKVLILDFTGISEMPTSFARLTQLKLLHGRSVEGIFAETILDGIPSLTELIDLRLGYAEELLSNYTTMLQSLPQLRALHVGLDEKALSELAFQRVWYSKYVTTIKGISGKRSVVDAASNTATPAPFLEQLILMARTSDEDVVELQQNRRIVIDALPYLPSLLILDLRYVSCQMVEVKRIDYSPAPLLEELKLEGWSGTQVLPFLPSLKSLKINYCHELNRLWEPVTAPAKLQQLKVNNCRNLSWTSDDEYLSDLFSKLRELDVGGLFQNNYNFMMISMLGYDGDDDVVQLPSAPHLPCVESLTLREWDLEKYGGKVDSILNWVINKLPLLSKFTIDSLKGVESMRGKWHELESLQTLTIVGFPFKDPPLSDWSLHELVDEEDNGAPTTSTTPPKLTQLILEEITKDTLLDLPDMPYLKKLVIGPCLRGIDTLPESDEPMKFPQELEEFVLVNCWYLKSFPRSWVEGLTILPNLKSIRFQDCGGLKVSLPKSFVEKGLEIVGICPFIKIV